MKNATRNTHPMILVAATAVTIASLTAVASLAGWLPAGHEATPAPVAQLATSTQSTASEKSAALSSPPAPSNTANPPEQRPARRVAAAHKTAAPAAAPVYAPPAPSAAVPVANKPAGDSGIYVENSRPPQSLCHDCGTVESIREIDHEGQGSGLGAIAGGVLGGLLGNQIGNGGGRKVATVAGVLGGAYAGHTVEKKTRSTQQFEVTVRLDDGSVRTLSETQQPAWHTGDRVRISDNRIVGL